MQLIYAPEETMPTFLPIAIKATYTINETYLDENNNIKYYDDVAEIDKMKEQLAHLKERTYQRKKISIAEKQQLVNEISKMSSEHITQLFDVFDIKKQPGEIVEINLNNYNDNELKIIQQIVNGTYSIPSPQNQ